MAVHSSASKTETLKLAQDSLVPKWTVLSTTATDIKKSRKGRTNRRRKRLLVQKEKRNSTSTRTNAQVINEIIDDLWIVIFHFLDVKSFISTKHICKHFHNLHSKFYAINNKYWQLQSNHVCRSIDPNYSTNDWFDFYVQLRRILKHKDELTSSKVNNMDTKKNGSIDLKSLDTAMFAACKYDCPLIFDLLFSQNTNSINTPIKKPKPVIFRGSWLVDGLGSESDYGHQVEIPLVLCCEYNSINMVKYLLNQENIHVNDDQLSNHRSRSPFFIACTSGFYQLVQLLLSKGNLTKTTIDGEDAKSGETNGLYQLLFYSGQKTVLSDAIYDDYNVDSIDLDNHPVFLIVSSLVKNYNADINRCYHRQGTALHVCITNYAGFYISIPRFVRIDANGKNKLKAYYLHVIKFLLTDDYCRAKIDVNARDHNNVTPLCMACQRNVPEIVQMLLNFQETDKNKVLDVNIAHNGYGWSPLIVCAANGFVDCLRLLLNHGQCDLFKQCQCAKSASIGGDLTVLMIAAVRGNYNIILEIYDHLVRNQGKKYSAQYIRKYIYATNSAGKTARQIAAMMIEESQAYFALKTRREKCHKTLNVLIKMEQNVKKT